ncbi:triose-phosphate isomerase [Campylobacter helveticus]|uniref:Triosephosphate isomerase n=1 Tax=Campylobacter helveticus TaxID=28898 RepID=A0ABY3L373_9BACT|nr:triose-phosphate isomerase [Campylobacter helveticus]MCR2038557.1 triose-phosphate isomerase [Campylobacter helveticus]MCR2060228.1 triose-phosphate isomerase [Campylobacter helveticus]TNH34717.1 triose-phosphate isomerase [Campylobacter helveticus]TNH36864.1 triose-phosphate isomerase [Campylobacter helveticus]TXK58367.1 triose-phosphate isomerase [Campylobacter helveticus]
MIYAANLKCNHTRASFELYLKALNEALKTQNENVFVFPPSVAFSQKESFFTQGTQNFYPCINGAFTGEIGKEHLDEFGIKCVLIGHSERRIFENEVLIKAKFDFAKEQGWQIFLCIGEDLKTKQDNQTKDFLKKQLENLDLTYENLVIAYEPIYSIGTGLSAKNEDIEEVLAFLRTLTKAPLLYGGSVNENNIKEITKIKNCGGVLIGSAALKVENFIKMIKG